MQGLTEDEQGYQGYTDGYGRVRGAGCAERGCGGQGGVDGSVEWGRGGGVWGGRGSETSTHARVARYGCSVVKERRRGCFLRMVRSSSQGQLRGSCGPNRRKNKKEEKDEDARSSIWREMPARAFSASDSGR